MDSNVQYNIAYIMFIVRLSRYKLVEFVVKSEFLDRMHHVRIETAPQLYIISNYRLRVYIISITRTRLLSVTTFYNSNSVKFLGVAIY